MVNGKEIGMSQYIYVKLKQEKDVTILESLASENMVEVIGNDKFMPLWYILSCDKSSKGNALEMANLFYESGYFESAEPDLMVDFLMGCTNDPLFAEQWHLSNTGQSGGTIGNDIRICQAWNITMGCEEIIVAVLDNGLEFSHPDFNNINAVSFDLHNGTSPSIVRGNHGVAVAGVIGATADNELGITGVAPNVQLMSISDSMLLSPLLSQRLSSGINFAWQNGADVINNSWGSNSIQQQGLINDAINNAVTQGRGGLGTIVVFSSGNDYSSSICYPSTRTNVIAVGAIGRTPSRAGFSNYGNGLDIVAPGVSITTTDRQGTFGYNQDPGEAGNYTSVDGTSFAAPQVSAVAALILSINPDLTQEQVRYIIESTADKAGSYTYTWGAGEQTNLSWNSQMGYGRLNAAKALNAALPKITGPTIICNSNQTFELENFPAGTTVSWEATPANLLAVDNGTGSTFVTRATSSITSGQGTITATIAGDCGTWDVDYIIWVGVPSHTMLDLFTTNSGGDHEIIACDYTSAIAEYDGGNGSAIGIDAYEWNMPYTSNWDIYEEYHAGIDMQYVEIEYWQNPAPSSETINLRAHNTCGWSSWKSIAVDVDDHCGWYLSFTPNPANGETSVSIETNSSNKPPHKAISPDLVFDENIEWDIEVYDYLQGPVLKKNKLQGRSLIIPTSTWKSGIYVVRIHYMGRILTGKLVVEK